MRCAVLVCLLLGGCNYVFGLDKVKAWDASPPPVAHGKLVWAIGTTDTEGKSAEVGYQGIGSEPARPDPPAIQVGPLIGDGPDQLGALADVTTYDPMDGSFEFSHEIVASPWRLVYQLPGDPVPHEVQRPAGDDVELDVSRTTRWGAPAIPPGSSYSITPAGGVGLSSITVSTSGAFSYGVAAVDAMTGTIVTYDVADGTPLAGPPAAPDPTEGDWLLLTRRSQIGSGGIDETTENGWAFVKAGALTAGTTTTLSPPPTWHMPAPATPTVAIDVTGNRMRLQDALGSLWAPGVSVKARWTYGLSPNLGVYGFLPGTAPGELEPPLLLPLDILRDTEGPPLTLHYAPLDDGGDHVPLEQVLYVAFVNTRVVSCPAAGITNLKLTSGFAQMTQSLGTANEFPAAIATMETLGDKPLTMDCVSIPASTGIVDLTWVPDDGDHVGMPGYDDALVTLYEVVAGASPTLNPIWTYRVSTSTVHVDGKLLVSGHTYVFGIAMHVGLPGAHAGSYHEVGPLPWGSSTMYPGVFTIE